jgi:mono/diheme cytochrome c family protein
MDRSRIALVGAAAALQLLMLGCQEPRQNVEPSREARAEAAKIFADRCARCHGRLGKGDGPEASELKKPPRNFADPTWQLAISDRVLEKAILEGSAAVGKSDEMPGNPDLADKPEVLTALRQHVRVLAYAGLPDSAP